MVGRRGGSGYTMSNCLETIHFDKMIETDWPNVKSIYIEGIASGNATFDEELPSWDVWNRSYLTACRIVVKEAGRIVGWAALQPISSKKALAGVAELSIYLGASSRGKGIGSRLMAYVIAESEANGFWTLQSGVFLENIASIHLHHKAGFRNVGVRQRIGKLNGVWRDIILLERRSNTVEKR